MSSLFHLPRYMVNIQLIIVNDDGYYMVNHIFWLVVEPPNPSEKWCAMDPMDPMDPIAPQWFMVPADDLRQHT